MKLFRGLLYAAQEHNFLRFADRLMFFWCFYCNIYEMKRDIFEIFRKKFRDIQEKNREFPETY